MPEDTLPIARLPLETQSRLRSTQILTSLVQIVSELLQNALDAGAAQVDVGLDCKEWMCWVRDDGHGIAKDGLTRLTRDATDGGRYNSSKTYAQGSADAPSTFGFRGEALASAADISCLEICSRTAKSPNTWSVILKGGETLYAGPAVRWQRQSSGTAVCVRDAFYNLPVRRMSHTSPARTWDLVRREIETYALMFPNVAFTLEDAGIPVESSHHRDRIIRIAKCASTVDSFRRLYGRAYTEHIHTVLEVSTPIKIEGFISLTGANSKMYQFLYINRHPVNASELGREIDNQFSASSFGKNALDEEGDSGLPRSTMRRSPRKGEKKPVYVLNISLAPEEVDNCLDPAKSRVHLRNKTSVITLLSSVIQSFLKKNGFFNQDQLTIGRSANSSPSPRKRKKFQPDHPDYREHDCMTEISSLSLEGLNEEHSQDGQIRDDPRREHRCLKESDLFASLDAAAPEILWTDPSSGGRFVVDTRTGNSFPQPTRYVGHRAYGANDVYYGPQRRTLGQYNTNSLASYATDSSSSVPVWLEKALESNRAYVTAEQRIPAVQVPPNAAYHSAPGHVPFEFDEHGHLNRDKPEPNVPSERLKVGKLDTRYETSIHRFSKHDLRHAEVISQVDRKFIVCRIVRRSPADSSTVADAAPSNDSKDSPAQSDSTLILIDQHAADERVRVEHFLKEMCLDYLHSQDRKVAKQAGIRTTELNPPLPVLLTQHEARSINGSQDVQGILRNWGIGIAQLSKATQDLHSESGGDNNDCDAYSQLLVSSVPQVVSDKLIQGNELRDFIKGILGQIQNGELFSESPADLPPESEKDQYIWLRAMRHCPKVLLDLISSKACRGAIMFNDSLSLNDSRKLVKQLSETAFPFQCAHGRPSLVPLIEIGAIQADIHERHNRPRINWGALETMVDG